MQLVRIGRAEGAVSVALRDLDGPRGEETDNSGARAHYRFPCHVPIHGR